MPRRRKQPRTSLSIRWHVALKNAGLTQVEWARQNGPENREGGWSGQHVSEVIAGKRESEAVLSKAMAFIEEQERLIAERAAEAAAA